jgi:hypothetical protein
MAQTSLSGIIPNENTRGYAASATESNALTVGVAWWPTFWTSILGIQLSALAEPNPESASLP